MASGRSPGHGGRSNAFTGAEDTCYFFEVQLPSARAYAVAAGADASASAAATEIARRKAAAAAEEVLLGPTGALKRFSGAEGGDCRFEKII
jgi:hypothetical protein